MLGTNSTYTAGMLYRKLVTLNMNPPSVLIFIFEIQDFHRQIRYIAELQIDLAKKSYPRFQRKFVKMFSSNSTSTLASLVEILRMYFFIIAILIFDLFFSARFSIFFALGLQIDLAKKISHKFH